jgi:hypothetical protein
MRNLVTTIFLFFVILNTSFSQTITAYSELEQKFFEVEIPDSLFVVFGERIEGTNNSYIDQTEISLGFDILLMNEPLTCIKYFETQDGMSTEKRIDLESVTEAFFGEDFTQDFKLKSESEINRMLSKQVSTKFGIIETFEIKTIKLIFLDIYGRRISDFDYYDNKFLLNKIIKLANK